MESTTTVVRKPGVVEAQLVVKDLYGPNRAEECRLGVDYYQANMCIESEKFLVGDTPMSIKVWLGKLVYARIGLQSYGDPGIRVKGKLVTDVETMDLDYEGPVKVEGGPGVEHNMFLPWNPRAPSWEKTKDLVVEVKLEVPLLPSTTFTLVFEGEEVPCHKEVLSAGSPVLGTMMEAMEGKANIQISAEVGKALVGYIYDGVVAKELMNVHASTFLSSGEMYNIQGLKDMAELELLSQLKKENMVDMIHLGELHRAQALFEAALRMTMVNMTWLRNQVNSASSFLNNSNDEIFHPGGRHGRVEEAEQGYLGEAYLKNPK